MPETEVGSGTWIQVKPGVPEVFTTIAERINSVAEALLLILNIALTILNIIKAFLIGFLNPIIAIIEAVIRTIEALLSDIRQIGIYYTGDLNIGADFASIRGGFASYERRMIGRLVDRKDPGRPDFSAGTGALAIFLYVNVDISQIEYLIRVINQIKRFFGMQGSAKTYSKPVGLEAKYGTAAISIGAFKQVEGLMRQGDTPTAARLTWSMAPVVSGGVSYPMASPKGFLIEVSTIRDGLMLGWEHPVDDPRLDNRGQQSQVSGVFIDDTGKPFRLYGGEESLEDVTALEPFTSSGTRRSGGSWVYAFKSQAENTPIPLAELKVGSGASAKYAFQRTFYLAANLGSWVPGQGFQTTLSYADMPYNADVSRASNGSATVTLEESPASTVYVRISAVSDAIDADNFFKYKVKGVLTDQVTLKRTVAISASMEFSEKGPTSDPLTVTFPQEVTYLDTITAALAVLVLSRSDLPVQTYQAPGSVSAPTGLETLATDLMNQMFSKPSKWFDKQGEDPVKFRRQVLQRCRTMANQIMLASSSLGAAVEAYVVEAGEVLLTWQWADTPGSSPSRRVGFPYLTILESLVSTSRDGVCRNPWSCWLEDVQAELAYPDIVPLGPSDYHSNSGVGRPLVFGEGLASVYCRDAFSDEVYAAAMAVLNVATAPLTLGATDGGWHAYRLLPQGIPAIENFLQKLMDWLESLKAAADSIIEAILAYIAFVEARILQIQALIVKINALLQRLLDFDFPSMNGLLVTGNGTMGLLSGLVTAEGKPTDSSNSYGAGLVLVTGGIPQVALEMVQLFFPEDG